MMLIFHRLRLSSPQKEEGQAVVIVALFLFFVFLAFAALSIDGTLVYLHRRDLQNIADAAALTAAIELAQGHGDAVAYQAAIDSIATNGGEVDWYATANPADPAGTGGASTNVGTGVNLQRGIEIASSCDVRVALTWSDIGTYFAQFVGRQQLQVSAVARAGCNRAGGLQPIAIKRFGDLDDIGPPPHNIIPSSIYCDDCDTRFPLGSQGNGNTYDFLMPDLGDVITSWPTGTLIYQPPSPHADLASGAPGREYYILGGGVDPNVGNGASYFGLVNLDIRHLSSAPREYYNNVTPGTNTPTIKDNAAYYIRRGYCCDIPLPGDEVAVYPGNNVADAAKPFQETYDIGDIIAVIVYDGTVHHSPALEMAGTPDTHATRPLTITTTALNNAAVNYTLTLEAKDGFQSSLQGLTLNVDGLAGFADYSFSPTNSPLLPYNGGLTQRNITLHVTPTVTTVGTTTHVLTGTRMFYVSAIDDKFGGTGVQRYWAGVLTVGDKDEFGLDRDLPAVTGIPTNSDQNYPFLTVPQGQQAQYTIDLDLWAGAPSQSVTVSYTGGSLPTGFSWVGGGSPWTQNINNPGHHPGKSFNLNLKVDDTSTANTTHFLPFLVTAANGMTQTFELRVQVVPQNTTNTQDYVRILGYAAVEVTDYPNVNSVKGRIVSELWDDPSNLTYGLRARLIPWE